MHACRMDPAATLAVRTSRTARCAERSGRHETGLPFRQRVPLMLVFAASVDSRPHNKAITICRCSAWPVRVADGDGVGAGADAHGGQRKADAAEVARAVTTM